MPPKTNPTQKKPKLTPRRPTTEQAIKESFETDSDSNSSSQNVFQSSTHWTTLTSHHIGGTSATVPIEESQSRAQCAKTRHDKDTTSDAPQSKSTESGVLTPGDVDFALFDTARLPIREILAKMGWVQFCEYKMKFSTTYPHPSDLDEPFDVREYLDYSFTYQHGAADEDHGVAPGNEEVQQEIPAPPAPQTIPSPFLHAYIPQTYYGIASPLDMPSYAAYLSAQLHDMRDFMIQHDMRLCHIVSHLRSPPPQREDDPSRPSYSF
ncbi:hypothetical protein Scep_001609 [Stephania cephalantha]|uniref:Uncharacterized protein n=1 Tax=Stephania cephalantha TaxID=152367 RepID=A0AAP0Q447_9MAGN